MTEKPIDAPNDPPVHKPIETTAYPRGLHLDAADGRCNECGRWRCNGNCQFGGT